ncbi:MAG: hypothetical protein EAZ99_19760 [Alphaproteobacteria bacterium]|nr:LptA/OstA family protein [Alphaproteobacteria bacterium]TAD86604.1 MAG: hypothetical protein EAZ99_19760 [Alphaproteobacteria bacterium]
MIRLATLALAALLVVAPGSAKAQLPGGGTGPLLVDADNGIEWRRDERLYIATGNARAQRGAVTVAADRLVARYRETPNGGTDIYELEATGRVTITTAAERIVGERAVYNVDRELLVVTGGNLRLTTATDVVTARDSLEWWDGRKVAVARGDAVAERPDRRVSADIIDATVIEDPRTRQSRITQVNGFGNLRVSSRAEFAAGDRGSYNLDTNMATILGNVRLTQNQNQGAGDCAEVNMTTGNAVLRGGSACGRPGGGGQVRMLLQPTEGQPPPGSQPTARPGTPR